TGDCGPLPAVNHAEPPADTEGRGSFPVGFRVTYRCRPGYVKRPQRSDTTQCLANSQWSNIPEFCGRSCPSPRHVLFAKISPEDERQNFYAVNFTVTYHCRPGFERSAEQLPTSTCLEDLTWSEVPELCRRRSCGVPADPAHGRVIPSGDLFGAKAQVLCDRG
ncbi:DAF factor, partial [Rhinopomastus cyanomelas]|nr:DAF factor [Rhinopomastus cyanomelas]